MSLFEKINSLEMKSSNQDRITNRTKGVTVNVSTKNNQVRVTIGEEVSKECNIGFDDCVEVSISKCCNYMLINKAEGGSKVKGGKGRKSPIIYIHRKLFVNSFNAEYYSSKNYEVKDGVLAIELQKVK